MKTNTLSWILVSLLTGFAFLQPAHSAVRCSRAQFGIWADFTQSVGPTALNLLLEPGRIFRGGCSRANVVIG